MPPTETLRHFDALFLFQPFVSYFGIRDATPPTPWQRWSRRAIERIPPRHQKHAQALLERFEGPTMTRYDRVWQRIIAAEVESPITAYEGAFVDWDNTARYGRRATIYDGASPARFQHWMTRLVAKVGRRPVDERLIFINAWNEWAEGAYLEPDETSRFGYLEALRSALATAAPPPAERIDRIVPRATAE
jgi:glycosyl transferase family WbsX